MEVHPLLKNRLAQVSGLIMLAVCVILLGYFTHRTDHFQLISLLSIGFVLAWYLYKSEFSLRTLLFAGVALRILLFFMLPNLSDDIYRFIWDGQLLAQGLDPFERLPSSFATAGEFPTGTSPSLFDLLNSKDYFTVYPPLLQYVFLASASVAGSSIIGNIIFLRTILILSEAGIIYLLFNRDRENRNLLLYALNPAVILEITGNLHFDGAALFLIILSLLIVDRRSFTSGVVYGASVLIKLVPLIFAPLLFFRQSYRNRIKFFTAVTGVIILLGLPLFSYGLFAGMSESLGLYFRKFEFNASLYYLVREIGFWRKGYNDIAFIGPFLASVTFLLILIYSWFRRKTSQLDLFESFGIILTIYLLLATTVHPWYIVPVVGLLVFTNLRYAFVWSFLAMFSYIGYTDAGYEVPVTWIFIEYGILLIILIHDIRKNNSSYAV